MALPRTLTKEVFIHLKGDCAFVSTVKYGCFYSQTREFTVGWEPSRLTLEESAPVRAEYLVPPVTAPLKRRGGV